MIIDIGSGHQPHPQADVLLDIHDEHGSHRWSKKLQSDRPTVIYEGKTFPFIDNAFLYSVCKHVLEHVDDPAHFLNEISRISTAGYIETPSELSELIFTPYALHKWVVHKKGEVLIIKNKINANVSKCGKLFDYLCDNEPGFDEYFYLSRRRLFLTEYWWTEAVLFELVEENDSTFENYNDEQTLLNISERNNVDYQIEIPPEHLSQKPSDIFQELSRVLCSPCCSNKVEYKEESYQCIKCGHVYKKDGNQILFIQ